MVYTVTILTKQGETRLCNFHRKHNAEAFIQDLTGDDSIQMVTISQDGYVTDFVPPDELQK